MKITQCKLIKFPLTHNQVQIIKIHMHMVIKNNLMSHKITHHHHQIQKLIHYIMILSPLEIQLTFILIINHPHLIIVMELEIIKLIQVQIMNRLNLAMEIHNLQIIKHTALMLLIAMQIKLQNNQANIVNFIHT